MDFDSSSNPEFIGRGQDPEKCEVSGSPSRATDEVRVRYQPESRKADRRDDSAERAGESG